MGRVSLQKKDRYAEVEPELTKINFHHFRKYYIARKGHALDETVVIRKGIFRS